MVKFVIAIFWIIFITAISVLGLIEKADLNIQPTINEITQNNIFNNFLLLIAGILLVYWIILLFKYEKEKEYKIVIDEDEEKLLKKYNPLIAGCIQGNRKVLFRDVLAEVLDLVNKGYLKMELVPLYSDGEVIINNTTEDPFKNITGIPKEYEGKLDGTYKYFISINKESDYKLDEIEEFIVRWIFIWVHRDSTKKYYNGDKAVDLFQTFRKIIGDDKSNEILKELDYMATKHINDLGGNKEVPLKIKILNWFIFIITSIMAAINLNALDKEIIDKIDKTITFYFSPEGIFIWLFLGIHYLFFILMVVFFILVIVIYIINALLKGKNRKIINVSAIIIVVFLILIILTLIYANNKHLIVSEILTCVSTLIVLTHSLMLKNDPIIEKDYKELNILKNKIEEKSLLSDREIEEIFLWERYLSYAISFGINKYSYIDSFILDMELGSIANKEY